MSGLWRVRAYCFADCGGWLVWRKQLVKSDDRAAVRETAAMRQKNKTKRKSPKTVLRLPDLDHSKSAVLQTLGSAASRKTYAFAIDDFIGWYCSEPRLAFGRTVVLRYRYYLEARQLAPATINLRLAAVRRLAYEASDNGLLSPDLAAGVRRVKGAKRLGMRIGNWLTPAQGKQLLGLPDVTSVKGSRNFAMLYQLSPSDRVQRQKPQLPKMPIHGQLAGLGLGSMFAEPCPAREWYYSDKTGPRSE
jgi:hypothetical protein